MKVINTQKYRVVSGKAKNQLQFIRMIIKDGFRHNFYELIKNEHVLILVGNDVDALCSALILTNLLRCDDAAFSVVPVETWPDIKKAITDHEQSPYVIMLNCGGNRALSDLEIPDFFTFFVCDNRRPFDLDNIYNNEQFRILVDAEEINDLCIPPIEEIFREEDSSDDEEGGEDRHDRMAAVQRRALKREERRLWEARKGEILWKYYAHAWVSLPTSIRMLELAQTLNRATAEFMWLATVGMNSLLMDNLIPIQLYTDICVKRIRQFIHKFVPRSTPRSDDLFRISFDKELTLAVYTNWSLWAAMRVNRMFACKTKNWTQTGEESMKKLYARLGITLAEARQNFSSIASERKKEIVLVLDTEMNECFATFTAHVGYSARITAADVARIVALKLEAQRPGINLVERFSAATNILKGIMIPGRDFALQKYIDSYKVALERVYQCVMSALNQSEVINMSRFYLYTSNKVVEDGLMESRHFLILFQNFLLEAFAGDHKRKRQKPLIVTFPLTGNKDGWLIASGIMPLDTAYSDDHLKSVIGSAFEKCEERQLRVHRDHFNTDIILVKAEDRVKFFDCLEGLFSSS